MGIIVDADMLEIAGRGRVCIATLDELPSSLNSSCVIAGKRFELSPVYLNWKRPADASPVIGFYITGFNLHAEWFIGRKVIPV